MYRARCERNQKFQRNVIRVEERIDKDVYDKLKHALRTAKQAYFSFLFLLLLFFC